jgi:hypothetical protein
MGLPDAVLASVSIQSTPLPKVYSVLYPLYSHQPSRVLVCRPPLFVEVASLHPFIPSSLHRLFFDTLGFIGSQRPFILHLPFLCRRKLGLLFLGTWHSVLGSWHKAVVHATTCFLRLLCISSAEHLERWPCNFFEE